MSRLLTTTASPCSSCFWADSFGLTSGLALRSHAVLPAVVPAALRPARLRLGAPHEHRLGAVDLVEGDDRSPVAPVVGVGDLERRRGVVGGDEHALEPALVVADVGEADVEGLAELALEVGGRAQGALDARARDLERVVAGQRIVVVEVA